MNTILYNALTESDWNEKIKFLENNGYKRGYTVGWDYTNFPVIIVYDNKTLGGNTCGARRSEWCNWEQVLEFIGLSSIPDMWYVNVTHEIACLLKKLDNNIYFDRKVAEIGCRCGDNYGWVQELDKSLYEKQGYTLITLERAINYLLAKKMSSIKNKDVTYEGDFIIVDNIKYRKV